MPRFSRKKKLGRLGWWCVQQMPKFCRTSAIGSAETMKNQHVNSLWKTLNDCMVFKNAKNLNSPTWDFKFLSTRSTLFDSSKFLLSLPPSSLLPLCFVLCSRYIYLFRSTGQRFRGTFSLAGLALPGHALFDADTQKRPNITLEVTT